ncbi:citramalate synthase, partial [bacterium]|nr:citramalate synthase [bacterium]
LEAGTQVVCLVGKAWDLHVTEALRTDLDEAVLMASETVEFFIRRGIRVMFDAEHAFDGYLANPDFTLTVLRAAHDAGAERLILCDTNGGMLPTTAARVVEKVGAAIPDAVLGVHFHDDTGCAVASTLAAVEVGAVQVQGCLNGYGERTGNADLCSVIPNLVLKMGHEVIPRDRLARLAPIAHHVAEIANTKLDPHRAYVGSSAFAHKAGLHTSAIARRPDAYEHIEPSEVGNSPRMVVSELMGRATVLTRAKEQGWDLTPDQAASVVQRVKDLEHEGYLFEAADGSFDLLVRDTIGDRPRFFSVESFRTIVDGTGDGGAVAEATIKAIVGGDRVVVTREGDGPVNALDRALRAALTPTFPTLDGVRLVDFSVRDLDSSDGTAARVRVRIEHADADGTWGTVGVHHDIVEASWEALVDGLVVGLIRTGVAGVAHP